MKKKYEYRVHAGIDHNVDPVIIAGQRKTVRPDHKPQDFRLRNTSADGSWYFKTEELPDAVRKVVIDYLNNTHSLDYGAFDVIYNEYYDKAYIVEINSAPGIGPNDAEAYLNFFRGFL